LIVDKDLRQRLGTQAKIDVLARYDVRATAAAYHAYYMTALGMPAANSDATSMSPGI
jgi:hypothetical protein